MATSFIRISSEDGSPDNPIKCLVWLRAVWANTGLFQLCVCLNDYVEISMSLCERAMVYGQSPKSLKEETAVIIFQVCGYFKCQKSHFPCFIAQSHHYVFGFKR